MRLNRADREFLKAESDKEKSARDGTPEPWLVGGRYGVNKTEIVGANGARHVAAVLTHEEERSDTGKPTNRGTVELQEGMANLRLMVQAPAMLRALRAAEAFIADDTCRHDDEKALVLTQIRAALVGVTKIN